MQNLFVGLTPLHVLIAICSKERKPNDLVVLLDQSGSLFDFYKVVLQSGVIKNLEYIDASRSFQKLSTYFLKARVPKASVFERQVRLLIEKTYREVYVFNDLAPEVQLILSRVKFTSVHYVEDGSAAYNSHYVSRSIFKKIVLKVLFKNFYDPIKVIGTSKYVNDGIYSYPDYVRKENMVKPARTLRFHTDFRKNLVLLAEQYRGVSKKDDHLKRKCIIYLPKDCKIKVSDLIDHARQQARTMGIYNLQVVLKIHPLSEPREKIDSRENKNVVLCPKDMPGELLPEVYKNVAIVLGSGSTILMNTRRFYQDIKVVNIIKTFPGPYDNFLEDIGVTCESVTGKI